MRPRPFLSAAVLLVAAVYPLAAVGQPTGKKDPAVELRRIAEALPEELRGEVSRRLSDPQTLQGYTKEDLERLSFLVLKAMEDNRELSNAERKTAMEAFNQKLIDAETRRLQQQNKPAPDGQVTTGGQPTTSVGQTTSGPPPLSVGTVDQQTPKGKVKQMMRIVGGVVGLATNSYYENLKKKQSEGQQDTTPPPPANDASAGRVAGGQKPQERELNVLRDLGDMVKDGRLYENNSNRAFSLGDFRETYRSANKAMEAGRVNAKTHVLRGLAAERLGDYEAAHMDAEVALQFDPNSLQAKSLLHLTDGKVSTAHLSESRPSWQTDTSAGEGPSGGDQRASEGAPTPAQDAAAIIRSIQQQSLGDVGKAVANLLKETRAYINMKDARNAILTASKALELQPNNAIAYHLKAVAENNARLFPEAQQDASKSFELSPTVPALLARAFALSSQGRHQDALKDSLRARGMNPSDGFVLRTEARALGGLGQRAQMLERLHQAALLDPAKHQALYEAALQLPSDADTEALFTGGLGAVVPPQLPADTRGRGRAVRLILFCLVGGLLVAVGFLHMGGKEFATTTARRLMTGAQANGEAEAAPGPRTDFWTRYENAREVAKGGMGVVYEATDRALGRKVAVKKMREELRTDPRERERFLKEARTVAALRHANIVQIFEVAEDGLDAYLVFEFVDGETLHERVKRQKQLPLPEAVGLLRGICSAVDYAHGQGLMHRDLKPANIMIDKGGQVKVMDFGIARQAKDAMTKLSMTNTVAGTPPYMAPEQEQGMVCKESDVFSLGVIAYEMLSGKWPFGGAPGAMLLAKMSARFDPLSSCVKGLPAGTDEAIGRALHPDPSKRWRKPADFLASLEALCPVAKA